MAVKTVEERLTVVEQKVAENASGIAGLREAITELGARMDRRFEALEQRFDRRFEAIDRRFEMIDRRFEMIDRRFEVLDRRLMWLTGTLVASMLTVLTILAGALLGG